MPDYKKHQIKTAAALRRYLLTAILLTFYMLCYPTTSNAQKTVVVIPKATIMHFWKIICLGAHKAVQGEDVNLIWRGPRVENKADAQIHLLKFYTEKKVDAIVIAPSDKERLNPYLEKAVKAGIKVVIIDSPVTSKAPHAYIATDNYKSGTIGAELLAKKVSQKGPLLLIGHKPENGASYLREQGFINRINELIPGRSIIRMHMKDGSERETRIVVEEILTAMPSIAGIFSVNEPTSDGVLHVLKKHADIKIPFVAFDYNKNLEKGVKEGKICALITQKPYTMGFLGVKTAMDLLSGKKVIKKMESPVTVITSENMDRSDIITGLHKMTVKERSDCPICFN